MDRSEARLLHDNDLKAKKETIARDVLVGRDRAARQVRLTLARLYGRPDMASPSQWHVYPSITDTGTLGVVDVAKGCAWDSGVEADDGCADLGLSGEIAMSANSPALSGDVRFDGQLVQREGHAPSKPPQFPAGWQQIALPPWRSHDKCGIRTEEYAPSTWIRPRLVATGLWTCYGEVGKDDGRYLAKAHGWEANWPHGVPEWIEGTSVTVLDAIADGSDAARCRTRLARGTDEEEARRIAAAVVKAKQVLAIRLRAAATDHNADIAAKRADAGGWRREEAAAYRRAADELDATGAIQGLSELRTLITRGGNRTNWGCDHLCARGLDALAAAERATHPWDKAKALAGFGDVAQLLEQRTK